MQSQRIAIIDLGSNTARMVLMHSLPGYAYRMEDEIREVVRLRQGMTAAGLSQDAMDRAFFTLRLFKRFCDAMETEAIVATATSAVRDAANGTIFVERVQHELGLTLQILDGEQEAYYGTLGALNEISIQNGFVLDIGGGSAQISQVKQRRFVRGQSAPLGSLALTERFIKSDPVSKQEANAIQAEIDHHFDQLKWLKQQQTTLVGLGGTIRNLAKMAVKREDYPLNTLHGFTLSLSEVEESIEQLNSLPLSKRSKLPGLRTDRADIILPGAMVLRTVMERLVVDEVIVSASGLREGLFCERFWGHLSYPVVPDVRGFAVLNLARIYHYQKTHVNHVRFLSQRLFDQLAPLHGYSDASRTLLEAAALLHDLGTLINYNDHHHHSQMLIVNNGLPGYTPREVAMIALLARYHRKGTPRVGAFKDLLSQEDEIELTRLAAILRLAEYLERGRNSAVDDVVVTWDDETLRLTLIAEVYPAVEMWETERNAVELMTSAFNRQVVLESTATPTPWDE